jgi:hypothetical protein
MIEISNGQPRMANTHTGEWWERDRSYWLCRCEGFDVATRERRIGVVEGVLFGSRLDRPDVLVVRRGRLRRHRFAVPVDGVEEISPDDAAVRVADEWAPGSTGLLDELRAQLRAVRLNMANKG